MRTIERDFRIALDEAAPRFAAERSFMVTSNLRGGFHTGQQADLLDGLERQVSGKTAEKAIAA